jgi:CRP-like cAMP-binding protein
VPRADGAATAVERALALRRVLGLEDLDAELLTTLAARTELRRHAAGEPLAGADDAGSAIHVVLEGRVRERFAHAPERIVGPGGLLGDVAALHGDPRPVRALAAEEAVTLALRVEDLIELCEEHFALLVAVMRSIARAALATPRRGSGGGAQAPREAAADASAALDLGGRIAFLAASPTFRGVRVDTLGQLAQEAAPFHLRRGDRLWHSGDASGAVVVVVEGALEERGPSGRTAFGPGDLAGLLESVAGAPRSADLEARTEVTALRLEVPALLDVIEDDSELAVDVLAALSRFVAPSGRASA